MGPRKRRQPEPAASVGNTTADASPAPDADAGTDEDADAGAGAGAEAGTLADAPRAARSGFERRAQARNAVNTATCDKLKSALAAVATHRLFDGKSLTLANRAARSARGQPLGRCGRDLLLAPILGGGKLARKATQRVDGGAGRRSVQP
ncbi:MAG TPA: hypothetical protein VGY54_03120 [Polyangiaceae bacterium]|jgi:hypothetical protein|nr:hypothetical protein [Polyangiaceae bacterium]